MSEFTDRSEVGDEEELEMMVVPTKEYKMLVASAFFLDCLSQGGIEKWAGWDRAVRRYNDESPKEVDDGEDTRVV